MRFDLFAEVRWPPEGAATAPRDTLAGAEDEGWDGVWLGGTSIRHGAQGADAESGIEPDLHLLAAQLAATTRRVRIGVAATVGPGFHPLHLAEEIAMLDILSGGRLDWAIGAPDDGGGAVFEEQLDIALRALTGERFSYAGDTFRIPELACLPRPVQQPPPKPWIVARSPAAVAAAGARGLPLWIGPFQTGDEIAESVRIHREAARAAGQATELPAPVIVRFVHVAARSDHAREAAVPALADAQQRWGAGSRSVRELLESCAIVGDEAECRGRIDDLRETLGSWRLVAWMDGTGLDPQATRACRERLLAGVAPRFRTTAGG